MKYKRSGYGGRGWYFERSQRITPDAGIKARNKRGSFGETWWGKRWTAVLESFHIGARLERGRTYARLGQVISIDIEKGKITSMVQGSRVQPYKISIEINPLTTNDWGKIIEGLSTQAIFAAKLLAGEMPTEIEELFSRAELSLFPKKHDDIKTDCSCPDWSNPCKHIAAVYCLIAEEFDRDPFLIFKLRGVSREEFFEMMGDMGGAGELTTIDKSIYLESLSKNISDYWKGNQSLTEDLISNINSSPVIAALPKRLGALPFWKSDISFIDALEPFYHDASKRGLDILIGEA